MPEPLILIAESREGDAAIWRSIWLAAWCLIFCLVDRHSQQDRVCPLLAVEVDAQILALFMLMLNDTEWYWMILNDTEWYWYFWFQWSADICSGCRVKCRACSILCRKLCWRNTLWWQCVAPDLEVKLWSTLRFILSLNNLSASAMALQHVWKHKASGTSPFSSLGFSTQRNSYNLQGYIRCLQLLIHGRLLFWQGLAQIMELLQHLSRCVWNARTVDLDWGEQGGGCSHLEIYLTCCMVLDILFGGQAQSAGSSVSPFGSGGGCSDIGVVYVDTEWYWMILNDTEWYWMILILLISMICRYLQWMQGEMQGLQHPVQEALLEEHSLVAMCGAWFGSQALVAPLFVSS